MSGFAWLVAEIAQCEICRRAHPQIFGKCLGLREGDYHAISLLLRKAAGLGGILHNARRCEITALC
jgi:hypothetical protein